MSKSLMWQFGPRPKPGVVLGIGWDWSRPWKATCYPTGGNGLVSGSFGLGKVWVFYWWRK